MQNMSHSFHISLDLQIWSLVRSYGIELWQIPKTRWNVEYRTMVNGF